MKTLLTTYFVLTLLAETAAYASEVETRFLIPGKSIFQADFKDGAKAGKPVWMQRKSAWTVQNGVLRGVNIDGNGPFIRLHSKQNGGVLPEDYIIKFSFMTKTLDDLPENASRKIHPKYSIGYRFSFGHYVAKYQWRGDKGMDLAIGHGHAIQDERFRIEKGKWYQVTAEIRGDEILVWFKDGPSYYMQHDHFRSKPAGFEFFTHVTEVGHMKNLQVWSLSAGNRPGWEDLKAKIADDKRSFISSEHPDFVITKTK